MLALIIPLDERIKQIDYFHGWNIAQMNDEYESDIPQRVMIPLYYHTAPGILTRRIIAIQRLWRKTWAIKHQIRIIKLAEFFRDLYARARREGIVIPSLDYEQKLASRRYGGVWKYQRALVREHKYRLRLRELAAGRERDLRHRSASRAAVTQHERRRHVAHDGADALEVREARVHQRPEAPRRLHPVCVGVLERAEVALAVPERPDEPAAWPSWPVSISQV